MILDITEKDRQALLEIINNSAFKGQNIEYVAELKKKIQDAKDNTDSD